MTTTDADMDAQGQREAMRARSRTEAESIVKLAGFPILHTWELANGYWPDSPSYDSVRRPWWLFMTDVGLIQLGWRKRVLAIDWAACEVRGVVTDADVTKGDTYVHAYRVEDAVACMRELRRLALANMNPSKARP